MTTIKVATTTKVPVKYLRARCGVRYWEDGVVNGERDSDGSRIPCRKGTAADNDRLGGGDWCPTIDLATGKIEGWPEGTTARLHYKVCDDGDYALLDENRAVVKTIGGYVPDIMCPGGGDGGDYVVMTIGADGVIADWRVDLADFERKEDR
jgi:hypothetical protein